MLMKEQLSVTKQLRHAQAGLNEINREAAAVQSRMEAARQTPEYNKALLVHLWQQYAVMRRDYEGLYRAHSAFSH